MYGWDLYRLSRKYVNILIEMINNEIKIKIGKEIRTLYLPPFSMFALLKFKNNFSFRSARKRYKKIFDGFNLGCFYSYSKNNNSLLFVT